MRPFCSLSRFSFSVRRVLTTAHHRSAWPLLDSLAAGGDNASRRRFSEMDFDHNGRVSFPEFVAALESWAGVEEEDN